MALLEGEFVEVAVGPRLGEADLLGAGDEERFVRGTASTHVLASEEVAIQVFIY